ncbi:MAG: AMP-binding protein [Sneathiella sp.]
MNQANATSEGQTSDSPLMSPINNLSYVRGPKTPPLIEKTIAAVFAETVATCGPLEAAYFAETGTRLTYAELGRLVDELAAGLLALGLKKGDRIGIWSPNRLEWVLMQFATARIGLILVNINPAYRLSELEYALNKVSCKALVTAATFKSSDYLEMIRTLAPEIENCAAGDLRSAALPDLKIVVRMGDEQSPGMLNFEDVVAKGSASLSPAVLDEITNSLSADDPINIQFTSGTTGSPKGATLTHKNIINNGNFVTAALAMTDTDKLCIPVPLYHCFGMVMGTLGCITKGATMVFPGEAFDPASTLETIASERCTALYGVPTMFVAMLQHPAFSTFDLSSLRTGIMAGAPCPIEVMKQVISDMHMAEVTIAYGMTETSPVSFQSSTTDSIERRVTTVGRIHPHVEVRVVDEDGNILPVGEQGELWTRGYSVMQGYWGDPERTQESIVDGGWMRTGDLAVLDDGGYCNIVGRVKDMIIRGGENVYPREVEEYLYRNPKIQEVQVFGIPSKRLGEEVCTWVVLHPGEGSSEEEIRAFCQGQIAHYKIPAYVRFKSELPMTVTGKPQKFVMRDAMIEELHIEVDETA